MNISHAKSTFWLNTDLNIYSYMSQTFCPSTSWSIPPYIMMSASDQFGQQEGTPFYSAQQHFCGCLIPKTNTVLVRYHKKKSS